MPKSGLSIADHTVLGIVWREGPCTAYTVMMDMAASPSSFYRKRASTTYAVVQRLTALGLVRALGEDPGPRGERRIEITEKGLELLRGWMTSLPVAEAAYSNDLIRLRVNFLNVLSAEEREAFLDEACQSLKAVLAETELELPRRVEPLKRMTLLGLIYETRARIAWLEKVQDMLRDGTNPGLD